MEKKGGKKFLEPTLHTFIRRKLLLAWKKRLSEGQYKISDFRANEFLFPTTDDCHTQNGDYGAMNFLVSLAQEGYFRLERILLSNDIYLEEGLPDYVAKYADVDDPALVNILKDFEEKNEIQEMKWEGNKEEAARFINKHFGWDTEPISQSSLCAMMLDSDLFELYISKHIRFALKFSGSKMQTLEITHNEYVERLVNQGLVNLTGMVVDYRADMINLEVLINRNQEPVSKIAIINEAVIGGLAKERIFASLCGLEEAGKIRVEELPEDCIMVEVKAENTEQTEQRPEQEKMENTDRLNQIEAAKYLRVTKSTLYSWCSQHKISYQKSGGLNIFFKKDLDAFLENNRKLSKSIR